MIKGLSRWTEFGYNFSVLEQYAKGTVKSVYGGFNPDRLTAKFSSTSNFLTILDTLIGLSTSVTVDVVCVNWGEGERAPH